MANTFDALAGSRPFGKIQANYVLRFMSSSPASTVPSVLENSDDELSGGSSLDYEEEQFESERADSHEASGAVAATLSSSNSDKYGSDEFEDDQEATSTATGATHEVSQRDYRAYDNYSSPEEDDYGNETFEQEHDEHEATHAHFQNEFGSASGNQQSAEDNQNNDGMQLDEGENLTLEPEKVHNGIPVGAWCSKKIEVLRTVSTKLERNQPGPDNTRVSEKIPSAAVENLIHRATNSRQPLRSQQHRRRSMPRSRHKLKTVPASLIQRAHMQLWLAKLSDNNTERHRSAKCASETQPNSQPVLTSTFCSVKCEHLRGRLATAKISETSERWAALELVQSITAKQREVVTAGSDSNGESGRGMLHQVAMTTKLQLEDSIALRHQADMLLIRR